MINTDRNAIQINRIAARYNAENDMIPNAPQVTWTDRQLLEIIESQNLQLKDLQGQLLDCFNELKVLGDRLNVMRVIEKIDAAEPRRPELATLFIKREIDLTCTDYMDLENDLHYRIIAGYRPYRHAPHGMKPAFYIQFCHLEIGPLLQINSADSFYEAESYIYRHSREQIENREKENHEI